mmetsp:Transcript_20436/g.36664  ORF Transcript_20436/g.36664 Transcript_20436/m.36664 type:complete len:670 (-) Transcript_20436:24-2033(-)
MDSASVIWMHWLLILTPIAVAHKPMVNGVSCGSQFSSPEAALQLPDIDGGYWGAHRVVTCDGPVLWVKFDFDGSASRQLDVTAGSLHPKSSAGAERYSDLRVDALVVASGLPSLVSQSIEIDHPSDMTSGQLLRAPGDISTCNHCETLDSFATPVSNTCSFYDTFGNFGVYSSVHLDKRIQVSSSGWVAFWFRGQKTGKMWVMLGSPDNWFIEEDLFGGDVVPSGDCEDCMTRTRVSDDSFSGNVDFWELWTAPEQGIPIVADCKTSPNFTSYCEREDVPTTTTTTTASTHGASDSHHNHANDSSTTMSPHDDADDSSTTMSHDHAGGHQNHGDHEGHDMVMGCGKECDFRTVLEATGMRMHQGMAIEFTCDPATDFVRGMIPHHQGAVDMCEDLDKAQEFIEVGLVHFCYHVRLEQIWEMTGMQNWLQQKELDAGKQCADPNSMGCGDLTCWSSQAFLAANVKMHEAMAVEFSCDAEQDFVQAMIPHHQGAVDMCAVLAVSNSEDAYLVELCENITALQKAEISWMSKWLRQKDIALGASCFSREIDGTCFDILSITDICHDFGGDGFCDCGPMTAAEGCTGSLTVEGRSFSVSAVCEDSCGLCPPAASAEDVVTQLLSIYGNGSTADDHLSHEHHDHDHEHGGTTEISWASRNEALLAAFLTLALRL